MCPNPIPDISLKTYLKLGLAVVFIGLCLFCKVLYDQNATLKFEKDQLEQSYNGKVNALAKCSKGVEDLSKREEEITKNAKEAVEEAKKKAVAEYKASNDILFRKPTQPVITSSNVKEYGGPDTSILLKDYLATQYLLNDLIDQREVKND